MAIAAVQPIGATMMSGTDQLSAHSFVCWVLGKSQVPEHSPLRFELPHAGDVEQSS